MRKKIQAKAAEMGYRPDPMLAALAHYRRAGASTPVSAELAWINCWPDRKKLRSFKEFDLYWSGAFAEAEKCGYRLEEFHFHQDLSFARLDQILRARNVQGILLPPQPSGGATANWREFPWTRYCVARFGYSLPEPRFHVVSSDQLANGLIACENFQRLGYARVGLATTEYLVVRFAAGYLYHQMCSHELKPVPPLRLRQASREEDRRALAAWIKQFKPDAIFTDCSLTRALLEELGLKVPRDLGLATTSILDGNADAGIYQESDEIGRAAVQQVISLIHHGDFGVPPICREVLVEGRWVDGATLPPRKDAKPVHRLT
jgi:LacI family transcriptional regulator